MQYLTLSQVAEELPTHPSKQTVFRWTQYGCRGVRLESFRFGKQIVTTRDCLDKFCRELAAAWNTPQPRKQARKPKPKRSKYERDRAMQAAKKTLKENGVMK